MLFHSILKELVSGDVRFVLVGGVAANLQGSPRMTYDLDICYDPAEDNVRNLAALLQLWDVYLRGIESGLPFVMDAKQFRVTPVMTLVTKYGDLDVMDRIAGVGMGDYPDVFAASVEIDVDGLRFRALGLAGLVAAKRAAGRKKDRDQLPELEALLELEQKRAR